MSATTTDDNNDKLQETGCAQDTVIVTSNKCPCGRYNFPL
jgi:hypothetical protein